HHNAYVLSVLGTLDFGKKVAAIELGRVSTQDHRVGIKGENCLHAFPVVGRHFISSLAEHDDDLLPESIVGLHHQEFACSGVHKSCFLGWPQTFAGFISGGDCNICEERALISELMRTWGPLMLNSVQRTPSKINQVYNCRAFEVTEIRTGSGTGFC